MSALLRASRLLSRATGCLMMTCQRNIGITSVMLAKADKNADPIQRLFLEKLESYKQKSKGQGGKLVDCTPEMEEKTANELEQIKKRFGGQNLEEFPKFDFK